MKLFSLFLLALPLAASAGEVAQADLPKRDDVLEVAAPAAPLRESTPDPLFGGKAPQTGWVKKGEAVRVLDSRQYLTIFGLEIWLEVQKLDDSASHGWVFDGMSKDILKGHGNLSITRSAKPEEPRPDPRAAAAEEAARRADSLIEDAQQP